jgi:hypothetical protein
VALAWPGDGSRQRAFTLEYAVDPLTGERGAVLGEWEPDGHRLLPTGLGAEAKPFLRAVATHLDAETDAGTGAGTGGSGSGDSGGGSSSSPNSKSARRGFFRR